MSERTKNPLSISAHLDPLCSAIFVLLPERILSFCEEVFSPIRPYADTPIRWSFLVAASLRYFLLQLSFCTFPPFACNGSLSSDPSPGSDCS